VEIPEKRLTGRILATNRRILAPKCGFWRQEATLRTVFGG